MDVTVLFTITEKKVAPMMVEQGLLGNETITVEVAAVISKALSIPQVMLNHMDAVLIYEHGRVEIVKNRYEDRGVSSLILRKVWANFIQELNTVH